MNNMIGNIIQCHLTQLANISIDEIFDLTAGVYSYFYNVRF